MKNENKIWLIAGLLMAGFIVVNAVIAYRSLNVLAENQKIITKTLNVITLIKDLHTALVSAETGQRGYLLTDNEEYLQPYKRALIELDDLLVKLSHATSQTPEQQQNFAVLYETTIRKMDELQKGVALKQDGLHRSAKVLVNSDKGLSLMEKIYAQVKHMENIEYSLLDLRYDESRVNRLNALKTAFVANAVGLILISVIYIFINRHLRQKLMYTDLLKRANEDLEQKVRERTESLVHYSDELQRSNRELQNFAFVASHDLQEPLRKIRAFGARLKQTCSEDLGEKGVDYINRMFSASERMSLLIDDLLTFSRVFTQQKPPEPVVLSTLIEEVLDDLELAIADADAQIHVGDLPTIEGDAMQMQRLFQNLISNALKFRDPMRKPVITIEAETYDSDEDHDGGDGCCTLRIKDNGIGFEQKFAEKIFTLFQRLHGRDEYGGTGLGLAICRRIVERHGGVITAESEVGKGAEFIITLPLKQKVENLRPFTIEEFE